MPTQGTSGRFRRAGSQKGYVCIHITAQPLRNLILTPGCHTWPGAQATTAGTSSTWRRGEVHLGRRKVLGRGGGHTSLGAGELVQRGGAPGEKPHPGGGRNREVGDASHLDRLAHGGMALLGGEAQTGRGGDALPGEARREGVGSHLARGAQPVPHNHDPHPDGAGLKMLTHRPPRRRRRRFKRSPRPARPASVPPPVT